LNVDDIKEKKDHEFEPEDIIKESIAIDIEKQTLEKILEKYQKLEGISLEDLKKRYKNTEMRKLKSKFIIEVVKTTEMNQRQVAELLEMSEMSVSRYVNNL